MTDHPITPPPELVRQWMERTEYDEHTWFYESYIAEQAARWGADQELEACCEWVNDNFDHCTSTDRSDWLRASRRPKPPSLKEQALAALAAADGADHPVVATVITADQHALIRKALEQLDD